MKKFMLITLMFVCCLTYAAAQSPSDVKFDKTIHDFGKSEVIVDEHGSIKSFTNGEPAVVICTFTFTNAGEIPLVINRAIASCGCTVPEYTKAPIKPGEKGEIKVTYNGTHKFYGHFNKSVKIYTNFDSNITATLYIQGDMEKVK